MTELHGLMREADGIILGSPVYFCNISAQAKAVIDRSTCLAMGGQLKGKVGADISATWVHGAIHALRGIHAWALQHGMYLGGSYESLVTGFSESFAPQSLTARPPASPMGPHSDPWEKARAYAEDIVELLRKLRSGRGPQGGTPWPNTVRSWSVSSPKRSRSSRPIWS